MRLYSAQNATGEPFIMTMRFCGCIQSLPGLLGCPHFHNRASNG